MATDLQKVLDDAAAFQEGLNAFESTDFSKECPTTKLIFAELVDPTLPSDEPELDGDNDKVIGTSIMVKDYCSDLPVPGAKVTIAGVTYTANADGLVYIGKKPENTEYPVLVTADGYKTNTDDTLNNDSITIPDYPEGGNTPGLVNPY